MLMNTKDQPAYSTRWYWLSVCFGGSTAPNSNVLVSVSKRSGLLKSAKPGIGASKQVFLSISKAPRASSMYITCSFFLLPPSPDRCLCVGCTICANPLINCQQCPTKPRKAQLYVSLGRMNSATAFRFSLLG